MFSSYNIIGTTRSELNTELRFLFASAKVDGDEIVRIVLPHCDNDKENERVVSCVIKVLRTLKKEKVIQFYVNKDGFTLNSTEASFIINKYGEFIRDGYSDSNYIYIKM